MQEVTHNQRDAIEHLIKWKVGALFMEAGTGKTRVACELARSTDIDAVLYIAPLRTISNAMAEVEKWWEEHPEIRYVGIESIGASERIYLDTLSYCEGRRVFCVMDESIKIKNFEAKRTKRMLEISQKCEYRIILNGTPLTRDLMDLWAQITFLSPKILNMNVAEFRNTFCKIITIRKNMGSRTTEKSFIGGYANIDYLYSLIRNYVYECRLHLDVASSDRTLYYSVGADEREEYRRLKEYYLSDEELEYRNNNIFLEMTSAMQHAYCTTSGKFETLDRLFTEEEREEDTIIFCRYVSSREECARRYPKAKVLSYQKEAFGLNLQRYSATVLFDKVWDYALVEQAKRRTYRTGQTSDCRYYHMTGDVKLESLFDKCVEKKVSMAEYFKMKTKQQIYEDI